VFLFIGKPEVAISIGLIEVVIKMIIYFFHERVWDKIKFGKYEIKPYVVWLTGLSRSGKSEIAEKVVRNLKDKGFKAEHLDGRKIRNMFPETGYSRKEVNEHIKRVGLLAKKLEEQGVFVVASFLSPYKESREFVKKLVDNFIEVHISTPLEVCEKNDKTGIFSSARKGEISNLPGINIDYETPDSPDLTIDTSNISTVEASEIINNELTNRINHSNGSFKTIRK
jgi:adenylylsulfate kinase